MSALAHAFKILEAVVARQETGLTFSEVVAATGVPRTSVHRLLKELAALGLLAYDPETARYRGHLRLAALGAEVTVHFDLRRYARPFLLELHRLTGHISNLGARDGLTGVYLDKIEARDYGIRLYSAVGKRFPLHCTGLGKAILAFAEPDLLEAVLARPLQAFTHQTITDPERLRDQLVEVKGQGYALDKEEITRGLVCVAAPIFDPAGHVVGGLSVTFPTYLAEERGVEAEVAAVKGQAAALSGRLTRGQEP
jgi:DNA-binding IclR family transcriptional regulator